MGYYINCETNNELVAIFYRTKKFITLRIKLVMKILVYVCVLCNCIYGTLIPGDTHHGIKENDRVNIIKTSLLML